MYSLPQLRVVVTIIVDLRVSLVDKQFSKARDHFLYAGDPENFGTLLIEMAGLESAVGADVVITGAVLQ